MVWCRDGAAAAVDGPPSGARVGALCPLCGHALLTPPAAGGWLDDARCRGRVCPFLPRNTPCPAAAVCAPRRLYGFFDDDEEEEGAAPSGGPQGGEAGAPAAKRVGDVEAVARRERLEARIAEYRSKMVAEGLIPDAPAPGAAAGAGTGGAHPPVAQSAPLPASPPASAGGVRKRK